ncbi:FecR domain-containing protein [Bacteroides sp.]|uniref:FecR family protein n=1 Tax=Bacteroides sp. TaxID=29523 RepID=UPI002FCBF69D
MNSAKIHQIILSVLSNEATDAERHTLEAWLEESEANRKEYRRIKQLYLISTSSPQSIEVDVDNAWKRVHQQTIIKKRRSILKAWVGYAAMFIVLSSIGWQYYQERITVKETMPVDISAYEEPTLLLDNGEKIALNSKSFSMQQKDVLIKNKAANSLTYSNIGEEKLVQNNHLIIPKGKTYQLVLSDGTCIRLNSETELVYPTHFTGDKREVTLSGEGYFEVAKNAQKPFIVKTNGVDVQVLGTSFNVSCYRTDKTVCTTLIEGSVSILPHNGTPRLITPSEQCVYNKEDEKITVNEVDTELFTSWINGEYIFKDIPLEEIMNKLQRWYDFSVTYQDESLKNRHFSFVIDRTIGIDRLLEIINYTSDVKLERIGNSINIKRQRRAE